MEIKYIPLRICGGLPDRVPQITQWDAGQVLRIEKSPFPDAVQVLFKNTVSETLIVSAGITHDGVTDVIIPNSLLKEPYDITAYFVMADGESEKTVLSVTLDMQKRLPPEEYPTEDDSEAVVNEIKNLIVAANEAKTEAEKSAANAAAVADTLSPADAHYNPESWIAQSGVAVKEAVWEALCNATDYTDEQLLSRVIEGDAPPSVDTLGDFCGQLYFSKEDKRIFAFIGKDGEKNVWRELTFSPIDAADIAYENLFGEPPANIKAQLDFLDNERISQSFQISDAMHVATSANLSIEHECVKHSDVCLTFDGESEKAQSGLAVTEAIVTAIKPREWVLLEQITMSEQTEQITREGLSLDEVFIKITWGEAVASGSLVADVTWGNDTLRTFRTFSVPAKNAVNLLRTHSDGNLKTIEITAANTNKGYISHNDALLNANCFLMSKEAINKIVLTRSFPVGTVIEIWGIKH